MAHRREPLFFLKKKKHILNLQHWDERQKTFVWKTLTRLRDCECECAHADIHNIPNQQTFTNPHFPIVKNCVHKKRSGSSSKNIRVLFSTVFQNISKCHLLCQCWSSLNNNTHKRGRGVWVLQFDFFICYRSHAHTRTRAHRYCAFDGTHNSKIHRQRYRHTKCIQKKT